MKKSEAIKVYGLIEQWARAEAMSRFFPMGKSLEYADYHIKKIDLEKEIRAVVFGEGDLLTLAKEWGIVKEKRKRMKKRRKS